jgi:glycosyltransferase involved in cell wall biosynthesis
MRVAIVCDFLPHYSGAEKLVERLFDVWPQAEVFALTDHLSDADRRYLGGRPVTSSFIQKLPFSRKYFRSYLPFFAMAIEQLDVSGFNLVISCSHAVAKGVITTPEQLHICLCCTPVRYAWDMEKPYLREAGVKDGLRGAFVRYVMHRLRIWDVTSAARVDEFVAISRFVAARIWKYYHRESTVIFPPVEVDQFTLQTQKEDFYLTASRLVTYKNVPLIAEAFRRMPHRKLVIFGDGPDFEKVKSIAASAPNIEVKGYQPLDALREHMQRAKAFVYAAKEDFGIVVLEAQACGTPAIAFNAGAAYDTVRAGKTGILFDHQTPEAICDAVEEFESKQAQITPEACRRHAETFSNTEFCRKMAKFVDAAWEAHQKRLYGEVYK